MIMERRCSNPFMKCNRLDSVYVMSIAIHPVNGIDVSQWGALGPADGFNRHQHIGWKSKLMHVSGFSEYLAPQVQDICFDSDLIIFQRNLTHPKVLDGLLTLWVAANP